MDSAYLPQIFPFPSLDPNSPLLISAGTRNFLYLYHLADGSSSKLPFRSSYTLCTGWYFSLPCVISGRSFRPAIVFFDPVNAVERHLLLGHSRLITRVLRLGEPSSTTSILASSSHDSTVRVWNPSLGADDSSQRHCFHLGEGRVLVRGLAFSPRAQRLVSGDSRSYVFSFDLVKAQQLEMTDLSSFGGRESCGVLCTEYCSDLLGVCVGRSVCLLSGSDFESIGSIVPPDEPTVILSSEFDSRRILIGDRSGQVSSYDLRYTSSPISCLPQLHSPGIIESIVSLGDSLYASSSSSTVDYLGTLAPTIPPFVILRESKRGRLRPEASWSGTGSRDVALSLCCLVGFEGEARRVAPWGGRGVFEELGEEPEGGVVVSEILRDVIEQKVVRWVLVMMISNPIIVPRLLLL